MSKSSLKDLMPERMERSYIFIQDKGVARVDELCDLLKVSPATVRRDLEMLETKGRIRRVHGGAVRIESRLDEPLFDEKTSIAAQEKTRIAKKAAALVMSNIRERARFSTSLSPRLPRPFPRTTSSESRNMTVIRSGGERESRTGEWVEIRV